MAILRFLLQRPKTVSLLDLVIGGKFPAPHQLARVRPAWILGPGLEQRTAPCSLGAPTGLVCTANVMRGQQGGEATAAFALALCVHTANVQ